MSTLLVGAKLTCCINKITFRLQFTVSCVVLVRVPFRVVRERPLLSSLFLELLFPVFDIYYFYKKIKVPSVLLPLSLMSQLHVALSYGLAILRIPVDGPYVWPSLLESLDS